MGANLPIFRLGDEVTVATGPSTLQRRCNSHHRTTGGPGQGVDVGLPCPAINLFTVFRRLGLFTLRGGWMTLMESTRHMSSGDDEGTLPLKIETALVTAG